MKHLANTKKLIYLFFFLIFAVAAIIFFLTQYAHKKSMREDLQKIASEEYQAVYLSMYEPDAFSEETFHYYIGTEAVKCTYRSRSFSDVSKYLDAAFASGNEITRVYLGLDSLKLWNSCYRNMEVWNRTLEEKIAPYIASHPDTKFKIIFSHPSLEYWAKISPEKRSLFAATCQTLTGYFYKFPNVFTYFPGGEEWVISNPDNYSNSQETTDAMEQHLFLMAQADAFQITPDNSASIFHEFENTVNAYLSSPNQYPNLSDWSIVFFGDSIMGNYEGSLSIPGVISGLSNAHTYNCATGGTHASVKSADILSFPNAAELFIRQEPSLIPGDSPYPASLDNYLREFSPDRKLCFVIHYGLNDYFGGYKPENTEAPYDPTTYSGALRTGIKTLQEAYPDALIIVDTPNFITTFDNGTSPTGEKGHVLTDYVDAALKVSVEMNVLCFDTYTALGIDEANAHDYLADQCHLNEKGRFLFGTTFLHFMKNTISLNQQS